jgi:hypothetical protein
MVARRRAGSKTPGLVAARSYASRAPAPGRRLLGGCLACYDAVNGLAKIARDGLPDGRAIETPRIFRTVPIVDAVPVYETGSGDNAQTASDAARLAAMIVESRLTQAVFLSDHWRDVRTRLIDGGQGSRLFAED